MPDLDYADIKQKFAERRKRIVALHRSGVSVTELTALFGVKRQRIYAILRQETGKGNNHGKPANDLQ